MKKTIVVSVLLSVALIAGCARDDRIQNEIELTTVKLELAQLKLAAYTHCGVHPIQVPTKGTK